MVSKIARRNKIKARIRGKISGTSQRPRLSVFRSNKGIYCQVIDDLKGATLCAASSNLLPTNLRLQTVTLNIFMCHPAVAMTAVSLDS